MGQCLEFQFQWSRSDDGERNLPLPVQQKTQSTQQQVDALFGNQPSDEYDSMGWIGLVGFAIRPQLQVNSMVDSADFVLDAWECLHESISCCVIACGDECSLLEDPL